MASPLSHLYDSVRHPAAQSLAADRATVWGFDHLRGHKYCLLVTYRRTGEAVPTPVWFGVREQKLYVRTEADAAKVKRIRNDARARVAPCTARGKPLGPPAAARARVLDEEVEIAAAEAALEANYGLGRKLYERAGGVVGTDAVYLEVAPA